MIEDAERLESIRSMHSNHRTAARAVQAFALAALQLLDVDGMTPAHVARLLDLGTRIERQVLTTTVEPRTPADWCDAGRRTRGHVSHVNWSTIEGLPWPAHRLVFAADLQNARVLRLYRSCLLGAACLADAPAVEQHAAEISGVRGGLTAVGRRQGAGMSP